MVESDEFVGDFQLLRQERISRARNKDSGQFLNAYRYFGRHQISQHVAAHFAVRVDEPSAQALLQRGCLRRGATHGAGPAMLLALAGGIAAGALARPQARVGAEPGSADRAGFLLHGLLAEPVSPVQVTGGGSDLTGRPWADLGGGEVPGAPLRRAGRGYPPGRALTAIWNTKSPRLCAGGSVGVPAAARSKVRAGRQFGLLRDGRAAR